MTMCERLSDRMAEVARGGRPWSADEAEHLATCVECGSEWRLFTAGNRLGAELPALDPARISKRVHQRLAAGGAEAVPFVKRRPVRWALGLAAAAAVILAVRLVGPGTIRDSGVPVSLTVLSELDELTSQELASVLEGLESDRPAPVPDGPGLGDLTAGELEHLLRSFEGST